MGRILNLLKLQSRLFFTWKHLMTEPQIMMLSSSSSAHPGPGDEVEAVMSGGAYIKPWFEHWAEKPLWIEVERSAFIRKAVSMANREKTKVRHKRENLMR